MTVPDYHSYTDNDRPAIKATNNDPAVEGGSNVELTCLENISSNETVDSYQWFKNGSLVKDQTGKTIDIGNNRSANGKYTAKVSATRSGTSKESAEVLIDFMCKYIFLCSLHLLTILTGREI